MNNRSEQSKQSERRVSFDTSTRSRQRRFSKHSSSDRRRSKDQYVDHLSKDEKKFIKKVKTFLIRLTLNYRRSSRKTSIKDEKVIEHLCKRNKTLTDVLRYILSHRDHPLYRLVKDSFKIPTERKNSKQRDMTAYDFIYANHVYDEFGKKEKMRKIFNDLLDVELGTDDLIQMHGDIITDMLTKNDEVNKLIKVFNEFKERK
jgi:hypothetical protein